MPFLAPCIPNDDRYAPWPRRARQTGSVAISVAIAFSTLLILLIGTELGYLFYQKRELQKAADLAALAGAQRIHVGCQTAIADALANANGSGENDPERNLPHGFILKPEQVECGRWDRADTDTDDHFNPTATVDELNAVRVQIHEAPPSLLPFFPGERRVTVKAVAAQDEPIASFSLGTGLASLDQGALNMLLGALLGSNVSLDLASYQGLAHANIRLLDLVSARLGVGTVAELLAADVKLADFFLAVIDAVNPNDTLAIQALQSLVSATVGSLHLPVGQLLDVQLANVEQAADVLLNVFELIMAGAQIANNENAVSLGSGIDLGPLAKVDARIRIVEPPAIAIGPAGRDENGNWRTQAHSAVIRVLLDARVVDTTQLPLIGGIVGIQLLHLPLYLETVPGDAWLEDIECSAPKENSRVWVGSSPGLLNACIADISTADFNNTSHPVACNKKATISQIKLLSILSVIDIDATVPLTGQTPANPSGAPLVFDGEIGNEDDIQRTNSNAVGGLLSSLVGNLGRNLELDLKLLGIIPLPVGDLLGEVLAQLNTLLLDPLLNILDLLIEPLLRVLGVQLGYAEIHHQSLTCGKTQLVY